MLQGNKELPGVPWQDYQIINNILSILFSLRVPSFLFTVDPTLREENVEIYWKYDQQ